MILNFICGCVNEIRLIPIFFLFQMLIYLSINIQEKILCEMENNKLTDVNYNSVRL